MKFSQRSDSGSRDLNPLILLYGPPGTGKTTLCQGLAQKISVRLKHKYKHTKLIQIKTATLLSKYFSESAKQVDQIFTKLAQMCEEDPDEFMCVLVDEVESIAVSREKTIEHGESQDSLRVTNALLTGLDRTKNYPNIIFLCTSNMLGSLDPAFLDRCGVKQSVEPPSPAAQYEILRGRIQRGIAQGSIISQTVLPSFKDAEMESYLTSESPGSKLLSIVKLIRSGNAHAQSGQQMSGRALTQLPAQAILRYLREEESDLSVALAFMERFVLSEQSQGKRRDEIKVHTDKGFEILEIRGRKRTVKIMVEEDCDIELLEKLVASVRGRGRDEASKSR